MPNSSTSINPATTGDTENGKSISVTSAVRPGKLKRATAHAAASPNTRLHTTAAGATVRVRSTDARVSGSAVRFRQYAPGPSANASANTLATGTITSTVSTSTAI